MRVLVAMSGGVDSSVAAALLVEAGHQVAGVTLKLWGGTSDAGCCSVADVEDARRVADQLGITHHVFNFSADFQAHVVDHYVAGHAAGSTPNPCIECNRHLKFDRLLDRAAKLGFSTMATGHHSRSIRCGETWHLRRGADRAKDQSYVLSMLGQDQLVRCLFPVGQLTKPEVRAHARALGLRTAAKPDSQDTCFITSTGGRARFLAERMELHPGRMIEATSGGVVGEVAAVELVTVGQRRGLGSGPGGQRRYAVAVDPASATVTVGQAHDLVVDQVELDRLTWVDRPVPWDIPLLAQCSAHGEAAPAALRGAGTHGRAVLAFAQPHRRVAPGQTVALYDGDEVLGAGVALR